MAARSIVKVVLMLVVAGLGMLSGRAQAVSVSGQLGILTPETLAGDNPATGEPWRPGDQYRFVFHTSATRTADSNDIEVYNAWVQSLADASTVYNIGADDGVTWKAIGSTDEVDARDNTSTNPEVDGVGCAIYLLDGSTLVASNNEDLWDGEIDHIINLTEIGTEWAHWPFTGTYKDGTKAPGHGGSFSALGGGGQIHQGCASVADQWVWRVWTGDPPETELPMYALSEPLTIQGDPNAPSVDAGVDMITWSGEPVQLDPNIVEQPGSSWTNLTYQWTANPPENVVFDPSADVEAPAITITKPATVTKSITVGNAGFESPVLEDGFEESNPPSWTDGYYDLANPTEWVVDEALAGVYNPDASMGYGGVVPEGENAGYTTANSSRDSGMSQVLSATLEANTRYELTVQVGNPFLFNGSTTTANYRVELLAGGVLLASDTGPSPADDTTWKTATVVYDSGEEPAQLGEPLEIRLIAVNYTDGKGVDFDDVQLSAEGPAPEPYVVRLTLAVNNEGSTRPDVKDDLTIDVYDDACQAAKALDLGADNPGDFDGNCITDANDLGMLASKWLTDTGLTGPVPKP